MAQPIKEPAEYRRQLVLGHPNVASDPAGQFVYIGDELLVAQERTVSFEQELAADGIHHVVKDESTFGVVRYRYERDALSDVARRARSAGATVRLNHVFTGHYADPNIHGGTATFAARADDPGWSQSGEGTDTKIVVLDTGIAMDGGHPYPPILKDYTLLRGPADAEKPDEFLPEGFLDDEAGHGTFIAGVLAQAAPGATVFVTRVLDSNGVGDEFTLALRLQKMLDVVTPDVIVLSLGMCTMDDQNPLALTAALAALPEKTVVVAAAGNGSNDRKVFPAALPRVLAVAALECSDDLPGGAPHPNPYTVRPADYSNYGDWVDVCAIGDRVSTFLRFDDPARVIPNDTPDGLTLGPRHFDGWARWSGTSFAAPVVAGVIADLLSQGKTPAQAIDSVKAGPKPAGLLNYGAKVRLRPPGTLD